MKISIAMTTYNGEKYIEKQLLSLLNQTRKADEVIIADDRSTDKTAYIVSTFISGHQLTNWTFYTNDENMGFVKNFKNVINKASGDIIFLCDQDDIWHNDKLDIVCRLFSENKQALAINSGFHFIDGNENPIDSIESTNSCNNNTIKYYIKENDFVSIDYGTIIKYNISPGCTMAFRSVLKVKLLEDTGFTIPHDWHINLLACAENGLYFYNKELIDYRIHSSNTIGMSTTDDKPVLKIQGNLKKRLNVLDCMINLYGILRTPYFISKADKKQKKFIEKSYKFSKVRYKVLNDRSFWCWLKLLVLFPSVHQKGTFKMILGDLVFMLRLHR